MSYDSTPNAVHLDQVLTDLSVGYAITQNDVASRVFPIYQTDKLSNQFPTFSNAEQNRHGGVKEIAPRTTPNMFDVSHAFDSFQCKIYGLGFDIDRQTAAEEDNYLRVRERKAEQLMYRLKLARDEQWKNKYMVGSTWGSDKVGTTDFVKWDDAAALPQNDMDDWKEEFRLRNYNIFPNTLVLSRKIAKAVQRNDQYKSFMKGVVIEANSTVALPDELTEAQLAAFFNIGSVVIADHVYNSAPDGSTPVPTQLFADDMLLAHVAPNATTGIATAGLTFAYNALEGASFGISVETFNDDSLKRVGIEEEVHGKMSYDMKIVSSDLGTYISSVID